MAEVNVAADPSMDEILEKIQRTIATEGWQTFYEGRLAETIAGYLGAQGGPITTEDIRTYPGELRWEPPIVARSSVAPSRGQWPSRPRASTNRPVWTPPSRIAERTAARSSPRSRSSSSTDSSPAIRRGRRRACHNAWSASRLPTPAIVLWLSNRALSAVWPAPIRRRNDARAF